MKMLFARTLAVAAVIGLAGCASTTVKKDAFAKPPKLAVITIEGSAHGVFTSDAEDAKILAETVPTCLKEISKSHRIHLLPANAVMHTRSYAAMKDDGATFTMQLVPGYKNISVDKEKTHLHGLAREVRADGFIIMYLNYGEDDGFTVGIGPIGIGSKKPSINIGIAAIDPNGQSIWQEHWKVVGDQGIVAVDNIGSYSKIIAQYNDLTRQACDDSVQHLEQQFATK